jgi:hypothetical protein
LEAPPRVATAAIDRAATGQLAEIRLRIAAQVSPLVNCEVRFP